MGEKPNWLNSWETIKEKADGPHSHGQFLSCDQCTGVMEDVMMGNVVRGIEELSVLSL